MSNLKYYIGTIFFIVVIGVIILSSILSNSLFVGSEAIQNNSHEYKIKAYTVNVDISESNVLTITENITAEFLISSRGIYRMLPEFTNVNFYDENEHIVSKNYNVQYALLNASEETSVFSEDSVYVIRLGTEDVFHIGERSYEIKYIANLGNDRIPEFDQFYYNVIGQFWDTSIENITVNINFPSEVENAASNTGVFVGDYGSTEEIDFLWNAQNTTLTLTYDYLSYGEGITVKVLLDKSYYTMPFDHWLNVISFILIIVFGVVSFLLFRKHSNFKTVVPVIQFSVDKKFTSADVGYIMDKRVDNKDIASLIIFWAQKGYIEIVEKNKATFLKKLKNPEKMKSYEETLFYAIFGKDIKTKEKSTEENTDKENPLLSIDEIGVKVANVITTVKAGVSNLNLPLFNSKAIGFRYLIIILMGLMVAWVGIAINIQNVLIWRVIASAVIGLFVIYVLYLITKNKDTTHFLSSKQKFFGILGLLISLALVVSFFVITFDSYCDMLLTSVWIIVELLFVSYLLFKFNVRTDEGILELGDIIGLKNFIETAEKSRLEMLVKDNPSAFYNILPYAYVLGVYEKWCKKFEKITIERPEWYVGDDFQLFNTLIFINILNNSCNQLLRGIDTARLAGLAEGAKSLAGGLGKGGFGGGFAGGGFGGGGGGRW
ncbi:MAG: DUF2207 domain-containing protein [Clostridia bacterium]|nr:DUF2207 domain-containing protein [Clostridia bacterium]